MIKIMRYGNIKLSIACVKHKTRRVIRIDYGFNGEGKEMMKFSVDELPLWSELVIGNPKSQSID
jgi:hypothetical protein